MPKSKWSVKYSPRSLDDYILPESIIDAANSVIKNGLAENHFIFYSPKNGTGKTSLAKNLPEWAGLRLKFISPYHAEDVKKITAEIEGIRRSMFSNTVVVFDECEKLPSKLWNNIRTLIEQVEGKALFIFTTNNLSKIDAGIVSRCEKIEFIVPFDERPTIKNKILDRIKYILDSENIQYEETKLKMLVAPNDLDIRAIINKLQSRSRTGTFK